jgi:hypothetical protein
MQPTIRELRQRGYKVRVMHSRHKQLLNSIFSERWELSPQGGSTTIELTTPDKTVTVFGKSVCSLEDNFNRKVGNSIALGRALKELEVKIN